MTLKHYLQAALDEAQFQVATDGGIRGELPSCPGVWAHTANLAQCRTALEALLEQWLLHRLVNHEELPAIGGLRLTVPSPSATPPAAPRTPQVVPVAAEPLSADEELAAVIAVVNLMLERHAHRIISIRPAETSWSLEGRRQIHASHRIR